MNQEKANEYFFEIERLKEKLYNIEKAKEEVYAAEVNARLELMHIESLVEKQIDTRPLAKYTDLYVTDHAINRYLQRHKNINMRDISMAMREACKNIDINTADTIEVKFATGYLRIQNYKIMTYVTDRMR